MNTIMAAVALALVGGAAALGGTVMSGRGDPAPSGQGFRGGAAAASCRGSAATGPPRQRILSDARAAARVRRCAWEPRPANRPANRRVPSAAELAQFRSARVLIAHKRRVTGRFAGTTDEILQWAAWKWGIDENILRAQAFVESGWRMSMNGDGGASFGIMQLKATSNPGTYPLSSVSTAFNVDYAAALLRYYYDGRARWLNDRPRRGSYRAGDLAGSLGAYYSGTWHTPEADRYARRVLHTARRRPWMRPGF